MRLRQGVDRIALECGVFALAVSATIRLSLFRAGARRKMSCLLLIVPVQRPPGEVKKPPVEPLRGSDRRKKNSLER